MLKINKKTQKIKKEKIESIKIDTISSYLNKTAVIVYPTDTVYGIGCLATNKSAINKVFKIKKITPPRPLIVLIKSYCMLHDLCYVSKAQEKYIRSIWPPTTRNVYDPKYKNSNQPTTFILKSRNNLPKEIMGENGSLAVRLPKNYFLIQLLKKVNKPLISTSLNINGRPTLTDLVGIEKYFKSIKPDLIIDAGKIKKKPSRIIDLTNMKADGTGVKIIR